MKFSFVVTPDNIRSIDDILARVGEKRSYSIRCSDDSIILLDDINGLMNFPNTKSRRIQRLACSVSNQEGATASVEFDAPKGREATAQIIVKGEDDLVVLVSNSMEEQVLRTRQWYTVLAAGNVGGFIFLVAFFSLFIWGAYEFISWSVQGFPRIPTTKPVESGKMPPPVFMFFFTAGLLVIVICAWGLSAFRKALFPLGEFSIGDGERRISTARFWRRLLGTSVLLALAVSFFATMLWSSILG